MNQRVALIIGNSEYEDTTLLRLSTPNVDVNALVEVLHDPKIGNFDTVTPLINRSENEVRRTIARFFAKRKREDLLLLYFSGHGVLDASGRLFLTVKDTERDLLDATALSSAFITNQMDNSRSQRQVLILDCCHSGAFTRGIKGGGRTSVGTAMAFEGNGYGRVVLTASDSMQYALEGNQVIDDVENSVFTHYLIQGIRTGEADMNADGLITIDELYEYVYAQVVDVTSRQVPGKWSYKQQGEIVIAHNPYLAKKPDKLFVELQQSLKSPLLWEREETVLKLLRLLSDSDKDMAVAVYEALKQVKASDDSQLIVGLATKGLATYHANRPDLDRTSKWSTLDQTKPRQPKPRHESGNLRELEKIRKPRFHLRRKPKIVSDDKAEQEFNLTDSGRPQTYLDNLYEGLVDVVIDHATGLMWQKSGSDTRIPYDRTKAYVEELNQQHFASYDDWRMPTIPELMSLLESEKQSNKFYINSIFDTKQRWCWSGDKRIRGEEVSESTWSVDFSKGCVYWLRFYPIHHVRAVRSRR